MDLFMAVVFVISFLAGIGWVVSKPILASLNSDFIPMSPATALIFLGLLVIWFIQRLIPARRWLRITLQVVLVGMLICVLILAIRSITGLGPDLEELIYPNPPRFGQVSTARMSPLTTPGFFLAILSFILLNTREPDQRRKSVAAGFALVMFTLYGLILLGYLYNVPFFYVGTTIPVAATTALSFLFLSLGLMMMAGPACWPLRIYTGHSLQARLMRAIIPVSIIITLLQGFIGSDAIPWIINPALKAATAALFASLLVMHIITLIVKKISTDIDRIDQARLQAESTIKQNDARFRTLVETATDAIINIDHLGMIVFWNQAAETIFGYTASEVTGKPLNMIIPDKFRAAHHEGMQRVLQTGETRIIGTTVEVKGIRKDGSEFPLTLSLASWQVGEVRYFTGIAHDITQRKKGEEALEKSEAELLALFAGMTDVVIVYDIDGRYIEIAPTNPVNLILPSDELLGKTLHDVLPKDQADHIISMIRESIRNGNVVNSEYTLQIGNEKKWFSASASRVSETTAILVAHDISDQKRFEQVQNAIYKVTQASITVEGIDELYQSIHSILGELIPSQNFYISIYDPVSEQISFPYYVDQFDEPPPEPTPVQGLTGYVIRTGRPLLAPPEKIDQLFRESGVEVVGTSGKDWMGSPLKVKGRVIGVMAVQSYSEKTHFDQEDLNLLEFFSTQVAQVIERKRLEEEITNLSVTDELTGLYNRRGFNLLANQEMSLARRFKRNVLLYFCDVDNLKIINDTLGHAQGDMALKEMGDILKSTFREADILARFGGDEFVVLAPGASPEAGNIITERIMSTLEKRNLKGERPYQLTFSLGIANFNPDCPCTVDELITQADKLMYQQKQARK
jgi:diguanylate cyclase (GGDEF)-like protein/PAS domain S-box-containing protein